MGIAQKKKIFSWIRYAFDSPFHFKAIEDGSHIKNNLNSLLAIIFNDLFVD